ncbi:uncharacterized protein LOC133744332 [Rosa rugosa]|uniref:uncharacterized protein LOC133744332 n=1 Tax=Rosa rugosa TaxID=74645 RepID=UPI002B401229|nr:uncharacterized protein LOC133744332 [Rosa rugosa]
MKRLKLLPLNHVELTGDYSYLSKDLRWLCCRGFSLSTIRNEFLNDQNLVSIDLWYSNLVQIWEHSRLLRKLKILNVSSSVHSLPERLCFNICKNLPESRDLPPCTALEKEKASQLECYMSHFDKKKMLDNWSAA